MKARAATQTTKLHRLTVHYKLINFIATQDNANGARRRASLFIIDAMRLRAYCGCHRIECIQNNYSKQLKSIMAPLYSLRLVSMLCHQLCHWLAQWLCKVLSATNIQNLIKADTTNRAHSQHKCQYTSTVHTGQVRSSDAALSTRDFMPRFMPLYANGLEWSAVPV